MDRWGDNQKGLEKGFSDKSVWKLKITLESQLSSSLVLIISADVDEEGLPGVNTPGECILYGCNYILFKYSIYL